MEGTRIGRKLKVAYLKTYYVYVPIHHIQAPIAVALPMDSKMIFLCVTAVGFLLFFWGNKHLGDKVEGNREEDSRRVIYIHPCLDICWHTQICTSMNIQAWALQFCSFSMVKIS